MDVMQKIEEAAMLLREAALYLQEESDLILLEYEIKIKPQRPAATVLIDITDPGENLPPSK